MQEKVVLDLVCVWVCDTREAWCREISLIYSVWVRWGVCDTRDAWCRKISLRSKCGVGCVWGCVCDTRDAWCREIIHISSVGEGLGLGLSLVWGVWGCVILGIPGVGKLILDLVGEWVWS